jgi:hypothetical protein
VGEGRREVCADEGERELREGDLDEGAQVRQKSNTRHRSTG